MDLSGKISLPRISRRAHGDLIGLQQLRRALSHIEGDDTRDTPSQRWLLEDILEAENKRTRQRIRRLLPSLSESLRATTEAVLRATDQRRNEGDAERDDARMSTGTDDPTYRPSRPDPDRFRAMTPQELLHASGSTKAVGKDPAPPDTSRDGDSCPEEAEMQRLARRLGIDRRALPHRLPPAAAPGATPRTENRPNLSVGPRGERRADLDQDRGEPGYRRIQLWPPAHPS